ncbi:MAG TPA: cytochrome b N-terminal domain-containing protein, partial [Myxococcota bacterium]|nr:cytochrome b N-terminal domain-containing protein [Myxococcota bacterium]
MSAPNRLQQLAAAIDERTGFSSLKRAFLGQPQHGAASWGRALGAASLAIFLFVCATGVGLSLSYSPSTASAWASVAHLETRVPLGGFIRSAHYLGTSALFITLGLHLLHIFATAAYRRPREAGWLLGLATLLVLPLFAITGNLLPMDED